MVGEICYRDELLWICQHLKYIQINFQLSDRHIEHCEKHHILLQCIGFYYYRFDSFLKNLGCQFLYLVGW